MGAHHRGDRLRLRGADPPGGRPALSGQLPARGHWGDPPVEKGIGALREWLAQIDTELADRFWKQDDIEQLVHSRASAVDHLVIALWHAATNLPDNACLVAVGGYGRGELHPCSDIDLMLLLADGEDASRDGVGAFLTSLWDLRLDIGHSVRDLDECEAQAADDVTIMTTLMEARLLAGPLPLFERLQNRLSPQRMWPGPAFYRAKHAEQIQRHARFGDTAYNLEPNLKEGPGGLRDIQMITWVAIRHYGIQRLEGLSEVGLLEPDEVATLREGRRHLWQLRFGLHLLAERREDRLLFDHQRELARRLGLRDAHRENLAVEQLMQNYFRTVMQLERVNERVLQAFEEALLLDTEEARIEIIDDWFEVRNGYLAARDEDVFRQRPALLIEMFQRMAERPDIRGVRAGTVRLIRRSLDLIDDAFRASPEVRRAFISLLRTGGDIPALLARMHRYDILGRYLPVFGRIAGRMQYDLFHVYTVDQHTLTVLRRIRDFTAAPEPERFPLTADLMWRLPKPELLYIAGFFHDIAKGRGGDHSELGATDARAFCRAHELSSADTNLVTWLVEHHLLMSVTAQKQDIADPEVVNEFAATVGNQRYLDFLYLLTAADIAATSPKLWNNWKATLLKELYQLARSALRRGLENPARREEWIDDTKQDAIAHLRQRDVSPEIIRELWSPFPSDYFLRHSADQVAWQTLLLSENQDWPLVGLRQLSSRGTTEIFICAENRDGTFATIVTTLGKLDLNVIDARVFNTDDHRILDTFQVLDQDHHPLDDFQRIQRVRERLVAELSRRPLLPGHVEQRIPRRLKHFVRKPRIQFSELPEGRTEMELRASDRPGLLAIVAGVFFEHRVRVHGARIATFGERVEDFFVISDQDDCPIGDALQQKLAREIPEAIGEGLPDAVVPL